MKHFLTLAFTASLLATTSCSSRAPATPDRLITAGQNELNSGDAEAALEKFDAALAQLEPSAPEFPEAQYGRLQALIGVDAEQAETEFLEQAEGNDAMTAVNYVRIAGLMTNSKAFGPAIAVLDAGIQRYGMSDDLEAALRNVEAAATYEGNSEALAELTGLGYVK